MLVGAGLAENNMVTVAGIPPWKLKAFWSQLYHGTTVYDIPYESLHCLTRGAPGNVTSYIINPFY
jgi:hypothetical protein